MIPHDPKRLGDKMGFGKYPVLTLREVLEYDPDYVQWLITNTDFEMDNEAFKVYQDAIE
jgi:hypothetical protein